MGKRLFMAMTTVTVAVLAMLFLISNNVGAVTQNTCRAAGYGYSGGKCYNTDKKIETSRSGQEKSTFSRSCGSGTVTVGNYMYCVVDMGGSTETSDSNDDDTTPTGGGGTTDSSGSGGGTTDSSGSGGDSSGGSSDSSGTPTMTESNTKNSINSNENASTAASCGGVNTSIIDCNDDGNDGGGIFGVLLIILNVLTFGIGIAGTLGIVIAGVMYLTARDSEAQLTKAKNMLLNVVIGLVAYALLWAFLQWLIPGGIIGG